MCYWECVGWEIEVLRCHLKPSTLRLAFKDLLSMEMSEKAEKLSYSRYMVKWKPAEFGFLTTGNSHNLWDSHPEDSIDLLVCLVIVII